MRSKRVEKEEFIKNIKTTSKRVDQLRDNLETEESTKNSLILPFFQDLGYDIFNPLEFVPEYTADVGIKKGEKVDYAIFINKELQILVECKAINEDLNNHDSQLFRYFGTTDAKFGILTNGDEYRFFTDLDKPNKMDTVPFLTIKISEIKDNQINELFRFTKDNFDKENIFSTASQLKYRNQFEDYFRDLVANPSEEFIKFVIQNVYEQRNTTKNIELFTPIIKAGLTQAIQQQVNEKLNIALNNTVSEIEKTTDSEPEPEVPDLASEIVTTPEEIEAYTIAKFILKDVIEENRVNYRDNRSYFNVLLDDNIRKWLLRVHFTNTRNFITLNDENNTEFEFTTPIDIYNFSDKIKSVAEQIANK